MPSFVFLTLNANTLAFAKAKWHFFEAMRDLIKRTEEIESGNLIAGVSTKQVLGMALVNFGIVYENPTF